MSWHRTRFLETLPMQIFFILPFVTFPRQGGAENCPLTRMYNLAKLLIKSQLNTSLLQSRLQGQKPGLLPDVMPG
ncbi:MAG: hypothetical protein FJ044_04170 [Candidatus Cloacimonetes bacterium]|nr:hypothetical protein [Candidatus Cloacimonadota bacterium]